MQLVYDLVVLTHLVGMAALVGGYLVVARNPRWNATIVWGARLQLLTGLVIVAMLEMVDGLGEPNHMKVGVKLLISIAVLAVAETSKRRHPVKPALVHTAGGLALLNTAIAVLW